MHASWMVVAAAAAMLWPLKPVAQVWTYQGYADGKPWAVGTFELKEPTPGHYRARILVPGGLGMDTCSRQELVATVAQEGDEQIVVLKPAIAGCGQRRMVLKADGSGGRQEIQQADGSWRWNGYEHILKRK